MNEVQTKLLLALAKKLGKKKKSKERAIKSLSSAGIMTAKGNLTKEYPNLKRVLSISD